MGAASVSARLAPKNNCRVEPTPAPAKLPYSGYLEQIEANVEAFVSALKASAPETPVPSCPDWSLADLASHAGDFAAFYSHAICDSTGASRPPWPNTWRHAAASPLHGEAPAWYFGNRAQFLLSLLRAAEPAAAVRTWAPDDQTAHFVARRSAHELAVHRFDAQLAGGRPRPIDAELAADAIEEMFVMLNYLGLGDGGPTRQTLQIRTTDQGTIWLIVLGAGLVQVSRNPGPADLTVTASASDLELLLYGRPTVTKPEFRGDPAVLNSWYRTFAFI